MVGGATDRRGLRSRISTLRRRRAIGVVAGRAIGVVAWRAIGVVAWRAIGVVAWRAIGVVSWRAIGVVSWRAIGVVASLAIGLTRDSLPSHADRGCLHDVAPILERRANEFISQKASNLIRIFASSLDYTYNYFLVSAGTHCM